MDPPYRVEYSKYAEQVRKASDQCLSQPSITIINAQNGQKINIESASTEIKRLIEIVTKVHTFAWNLLKVCGLDRYDKIPPIEINLPEENAMWTCSASICKFQFNNKFINDPTVVAHEYMHGLVNAIRQLDCCNQAGTINESISDLFAVTFLLNHPEEVMSKNIWRVHDRKLDQGIDKVRDDVVIPSDFNDNGNVHYNSQACSHAFYLLAQAARERPILVNRIFKIWVSALKKSNENESLVGFALKTLDVVNSIARKKPKYNALFFETFKSWGRAGIWDKIDKNWDKSAEQL